MAGRNEAKIKFTAETSEFNSQIKSANTTMASLRASLALNEAEFKNTGNAAEYLQNKQKLLNKELEANREKQDALNKKLEAAKEIYGENSTEATQMATKLTNAQKEEQQLRTALNQTENAIEEQNSALDKNEHELEDVADAADDAEAAQKKANSGWTVAKGIVADLASSALTRLVDIMKDAAKAVVNLGMDFTSSLSNVEALSGASADEMARLEKKAKDLGRSTIYSATDVSDAFGYMALAGWDVEDMLAGVDGVLNLAAASDMDLAKASDIVTDYLTAFGLSAEDSSMFVDQMAFAMANSNTNVEQLGEAYKNVASTAGSMGFSVAETTAALMTMANAGVKGGEAGTALNAIMTRLATDTKGCATELEKYGVEIYDEQGNMNSMSSILNGIANAWGDLTDEEQASLAKTIAGQSHYSQFQTVMNGLSEAAKESGMSFNDYTESLENCSGTAQAMTDIMQDNLSGDMKELGSAAEGLGLQLYDYFDGPLRKSVQLATDFINGITDAITPQKTELESFVEDINKTNGEIRDTIENVNSITESANSQVSDLEAYKSILLDLNGVEEKSEFQKYQVKRAVDELSEVMPELKEAFDEETGSLTLTNAELEEMFSNTENLIMQQAILEARKESIDNLAKAALNKAKADSALKTAQEAVNESMEGADGWTIAYSSDIKKNVADLELAKQAQEDANEAYEDAIKQNEELDEAAKTVSEELKTKKEATDEAAESAEGAAEATEELTEEEIAAAEAAKQAAEEIQKAYEDVENSVRNAMQNSVSAMEEFNGGTKISADEIEKNLNSQREGLANWTKNMQRLGQEAGHGMSQSFYDKLVEMGPQSANLVQELVNTLDGDTDQFRRISEQWEQAMAWSEFSDSIASYTTAGKKAAGEYASGYKTGRDEVSKAVNDMNKTVADDADFSPMTNKSSEAGQKTSGNMAGAYEEVKKQMIAIKGTIELQSAAAASAFAAGMSGIPNTASTVMSGAYSSVKGYVDAMERELGRSLKGPSIQVPHFQMVGEFNAKTKSVPSVNVSWWAKGGIFQRPTIIPTMYGMQGVGEAGAEAVLPIDLLKGYIETAMEKGSTGNTVNINMTVDGAKDPGAWAAEFTSDLKQILRAS